MARRIERGWEALAIAALANAALVLVLDRIVIHHASVALSTLVPTPPVPMAPSPSSSGMADIGVIRVIPPALPLTAFLGTGDDAAGHGQPTRPSSADLPGDRAADRGGGDLGGADTWIERRDRADDAALRSQIWTSDAAYLSPRTSGVRAARSPEAITRAPTTAYGDRAPRVVARAGADTARLGSSSGAGNAGAITANGIDDARAGQSGATSPARRDGAMTRAPEAAFANPGPSAVDIKSRGAVADDRAVAAASDQRRPDPFDLTPPRAGGASVGEGVRGDAAPGAAPDGWGSGTAAARTSGPDGDDSAPMFASRRDPYFLDLFRRLDQRIEYPRELALALISGRVIASVTVRADGSFGDIGLHLTSGHAAFDEQVTGALRSIGHLGPVPAALLTGRGALRVWIPYTFKSPILR